MNVYHVYKLVPKLAVMNGHSVADIAEITLYWRVIDHISGKIIKSISDLH